MLPLFRSWRRRGSPALTIPNSTVYLFTNISNGTISGHVVWGIFSFLPPIYTCVTMVCSSRLFSQLWEYFRASRTWESISLDLSGGGVVPPSHMVADLQISPTFNQPQGHAVADILSYKSFYHNFNHPSLPFTLSITPSQLTLFLIYHFWVVSPPELLYRDSAFGLIAFLVLSLIFWVTCYQATPPLLGLPFDPTPSSFPLPLLYASHL